MKILRGPECGLSDDFRVEWVCEIVLVENIINNWDAWEGYN